MTAARIEEVSSAAGHRDLTSGVISPVMGNVYQHRLDGHGTSKTGPGPFADDLVVMCWSRSQAERALPMRRVGLIMK